MQHMVAVVNMYWQFVSDSAFQYRMGKKGMFAIFYSCLKCLAICAKNRLETSGVPLNGDILQAICQASIAVAFLAEDKHLTL